MLRGKKYIKKRNAHLKSKGDIKRLPLRKNICGNPRTSLELDEADLRIWNRLRIEPDIELLIFSRMAKQISKLTACHPLWHA